MSDKTPYDFVIEPREDNIFLELDEIPDKTAGGIFMSQEQSTPTRIGTILASGPGSVDVQGRRRKMLYAVGDRVFISSISGEPLYLWQYGMTDGKYRIVDERSVLGKVIKE